MQAEEAGCMLEEIPRSLVAPEMGVGDGIMRGFVVFWKSERFNKMIVRKCQDSTPFKINQKVSAFFQKYIWFNWIYLCFKIFMIFRFPNFIKIPPPKNLWKRSEKPLVLDPTDFETKTHTHTEHEFHIFDVRYCQRSGNVGFPKGWDMKNNICESWFHNFLKLFEAFWW